MYQTELEELQNEPESIWKISAIRRKTVKGVSIIYSMYKILNKLKQ